MNFHLEIIIENNEIKFSSETHPFENKEDIKKILNFLMITHNEIAKKIIYGIKIDDESDD